MGCVSSGDKRDKDGCLGKATTPVRLYLCTWNVCGKSPPEDFDILLDLRNPRTPDIYAIGLLEMSTTDTEAESNAWCSKLTEVLGSRGYVRLKARRMQGISLYLFVRRLQLLQYTHIESEQTKAGMGGWWGNKGGVSIRFGINRLNVIVVNSHLAAHRDETPERIEDYETILKTQRFHAKDVDNLLDHNYVFWMGDLNFRLDTLSRNEVENNIRDQNLYNLLQHDQLIKCIEAKRCFVNFEEGPITYKPTYKFDPGTNNYDTSEKQRIPAWCDRILWRVDQKAFKGTVLSVKQLSYAGHHDYTLSDHKPVTAVFDVQIFSTPSPPAVTFQEVLNYFVGQDNSVSYMMRPDTELSPSSSDWIGLYKSDFKHLNDYMTYVWAVKEAKSQGKKGKNVSVTFPRDYVPPGNYILCYISDHKNTLMGMSEEFTVSSRLQ